MKVVVSERAKQNRNRIARYILREFGEVTLQEFRKEYKDTKRFLENHPEGGQEELNLSNDERTYHYTIINGLTKLVYRIEGEVVFIVDMWDTRREPPVVLTL